MWKKFKRFWQMIHYSAPMVVLEYTVEDGIVFHRATNQICWAGSSIEFARYGKELTKLANFEDGFGNGQVTQTAKLSCGALKMLIAAIRNNSEGDRLTRPSAAAIEANNRVIDKIVDAIIYSYEHLPKAA